MTGRAGRKALKERELRERAIQHEAKAEASSDSDEDTKPKARNAFDVLMGDDDPQQEDEDEDDEQEVVKPNPSQQSKKAKKKKAKKSNKKQQSAEESDNDEKDKKLINADEFDEIDLAVKEVNEKLGELESVSAEQLDSSSSQLPSKKQRDLLAIDLKLLDAEAEMKKMFGAKVFAAGERGRVNQNQRRRMMANPSLGKTYLVSPREEWPRMPTKVGISMNMLQAPSKPGDAEQVSGYFDFTYSSTYQEIQMMFLQCVNSHDPGTISNLLHAYPFHIDALLQCSEIAKSNGDINTAAQYVERALFVYERSFHPLFNMALANSVLPYEYPENRAFFLALFRHISFISRKGCWRTCLELSKLLYSLDQEEDPLGALQMLDWYAAKAGEYEWIQRCWQEWGGDDGKVVGLPNWSFTVALAAFEQESAASKVAGEDSTTHNVSTSRLETALKLYPQFAPLLLTKLTLTDPTVTNSSLFAVPPSYPETKSEETVHLLLQLYTERCHHLWKEPSALAWFRATATCLALTVTVENDPKVLAGQVQRANEMYPDGLPLNVSRHIFVTGDFAHLVPLLPAEARALPLNAFDPMPPPVSEVDGDDNSGANAGVFGSVGWIVDRLRNLIAGGAGVQGEDDDESEEDDNEGEDVD